jgi:hypothetical protein
VSERSDLREIIYGKFIHLSLMGVVATDEENAVVVAEVEVE